MKQILWSLAVVIPFLTTACTEDGFTKVFECTEEYPYFSKYTHQCYSSESARDAADEAMKDRENNDNSEEENNGEDE